MSPRSCLYRKSRIAVEGLTRVYLDASLEIDQEITLLIAKKKETNKERIRCLERIRDDIRERVRKLNNRNRISNVLKMAESWLPTSTWKFDSDPMKLNLANGIYDLNANKLEVHSHEHLCLKQSKVAYKRGVIADHWIDFVNTIFSGDQELIRFVRQAIGFSLSGLSDLQALICNHYSGTLNTSQFIMFRRRLKILCKQCFNLNSLIVIT